MDPGPEGSEIELGVTPLLLAALAGQGKARRIAIPIELTRESDGLLETKTIGDGKRAIIWVSWAYPVIT
jgi:hypothetical protein